MALRAEVAGSDAAFGAFATTSCDTCLRGTATTGELDGLRASGASSSCGVATCQGAEAHGGTDRAAGTRVARARDAGHDVAGGVQAFDGSAARAEHARIDVDPRSAFGADGARVDLQGEKWRLFQAAEIRVRRVVRIAVEVIVDALAAAKISIDSFARKSIEAFDGAREAALSIPSLRASSSSVSALGIQSGVGIPGISVMSAYFSRKLWSSTSHAGRFVRS